MAISAINATNLSMTKRHPYGRIGYSRGWKIRTRKSGELCLQPEERRGFLAAIETHKLPRLGIGEQAAQ
jgi:hypothetical protein